MAILRNPTNGKFTVVDNYALRDENLSDISLSPGNRAFLLI